MPGGEGGWKVLRSTLPARDPLRVAGPALASSARQSAREAGGAEAKQLGAFAAALSGALPGDCHAVVCGQPDAFSVNLRYAKRRLLLLTDGRWHALVFASAPLASDEAGPLPALAAGPVAEEDEAAAASVTVVAGDGAEPAVLAKARALLGAGDAPDADGRAADLRRRLTSDFGGHWHVVYHRGTLGYCVLHEPGRQLLLKRGKELYLVWQHAGDAPGLGAALLLRARKLATPTVMRRSAVLAVCGTGLAHRAFCPGALEGSATARMCAVAEHAAPMGVVLIAVAFILSAGITTRDRAVARAAAKKAS